jgi:hypothetical protein
MKSNQNTAQTWFPSMEIRPEFRTLSNIDAKQNYEFSSSDKNVLAIFSKFLYKIIVCDHSLKDVKPETDFLGSALPPPSSLGKVRWISALARPVPTPFSSMNVMELLMWARVRCPAGLNP